jgi:DUF1680 family protein
VRPFARFHASRQGRGFLELPIASIRPAGWLRRFLETQRDGLTGRMEAAGWPFDSRGWAAAQIHPSQGAASWGDYEQFAYWVDGLVRLGLLLGDRQLMARADRQIDWVLDHPDRDGYLGPRLLKPRGGQSRWPHAVFFRALMARHSAAGGRRIPEALRRHFLAEREPFCEGRDLCNVEAMLWAHECTGDDRLLELARRSHDEFQVRSAGHPAHGDMTVAAMRGDARITAHGVFFNEIAKITALLGRATGDRRLVAAVRNAYAKIDRDQMLVDGVPSSSEHLRGKDPLDSHETCDIVDYAWSAGYLLQITGDPGYGDRIERACFNALPGAVRGDFRALQYFSCPNQVVLERRSNHNRYYRGMPGMMSYRIGPSGQCCSGNVNRGMPNYAARMWLADGSGGVAAALYGPCELRFRPDAGGAPVRIREDTDYPFSESILFTVLGDEPTRFPLHLRVPLWCASPRVTLNGRALPRQPVPGSFYTIHRIFAPGDAIELVLPMEPRLARWPRGAISVERGPLAFSLAIAEDWGIDAEEPPCAFPSYTLRAGSAWNYALALDERSLARDLRVERKAVVGSPWNSECAPVALYAPARRVAGWRVRSCPEVVSEQWVGDERVPRRIRGPFRFTPQVPGSVAGRLADRVEYVRLVPYGCTRLRVTLFPQAPRSSRS